MARALYPGGNFHIVQYTLKGKNYEGKMHTYLTTVLFGDNEKKYLTLFSKYKVTDCHSKYNKTLYKLFKILVTKFRTKYSTSPENTNTSPKRTNTSPERTNTSLINL